MKIENKEQTILGLHANFELDWTMHVRTGAKNVVRVTILQKNKTGLSFAKLSLS